MQVERRRFHDSTPRATYAPSTVQNNTKLCLRDSYTHCALLALGFVELMREEDHVLLQEPTGFEVVQ